MCEAPEKTTQALLAELDRLRGEYRDFSYRVSHDFSAQLRMVEVFSALLEEEQSENLGESGRRQLAFLRTASIRLNEMVQALLTLSRVGQAPGKRSTVSVQQLVERALPVALERYPQLALVLDGGSHLRLQTEPRVVAAILSELLTNAGKFSPSGSQVSLRAEESAGHLELSLSDAGPGIPVEHMESVFEIFRSLHPQGRFPGVGAGLAIARRRAQYLGGSLTMVQSGTTGCTCRLCLPLV